MKKQLNEIKRMQQLAGILKEAQIKPEYQQAIEDAITALTIINRLALDSIAREAVENALNILPGIENDIESRGLNEEEENKGANQKKIEDTVEKAIDSPKAQATLQKMAAQLSDEDKERIMKFMSSVNESETGGGEPDLDDVTKKLMSLAENNGGTGKNLLGQVIYGAPVAAMGAGLIQGMLAGGGAVGLAAASPLFAAAAAGAVLIGLYKIIKRTVSKKRANTSSSGGGSNVISNPIIKK